MTDFIHTEHAPDTEARIIDILCQEAEQHGMPFKPEKWVIEANENGLFLGGASMKVGTDFVFVENLAVRQSARGRGLGTRILQEAENRARSAGKRGIWLDTFAFQAPDFYKAHGFTEFGHIKKAHYQQSRLFFVKYF